MLIKMGNSKDDEDIWQYTYTLTSENMLKNQNLNPQFYQGRQIISRDTSIDKGVFVNLGGTEEALVVDLNKDKYLQQIYSDTEQEIKKLNLDSSTIKSKSELEQQILTIVFNSVRSRIKYSKEKLEDRLNQIKKENNVETIENKKIKLGYILKNNYGVCRHLCLVTGVVIEKLIKEGYLNGKVSIDRNKNDEQKKGHAWCRYTSQFEGIYILDTAQLKTPMKLENTQNCYWNYFRPDDELRKQNKNYNNQSNKNPNIIIISMND